MFALLMDPAVFGVRCGAPHVTRDRTLCVAVPVACRSAGVMARPPCAQRGSARAGGRAASKDNRWRRRSARAVRDMRGKW